jgi:NMD protein affecting ribosome stability and mRNA decay
MHNCPICGKPTEGALSESGLRWAICDDCMEVERIIFSSRPIIDLDICPRCGGHGKVLNNRDNEQEDR